jgi:hypothetical protein
MNRHKKTEINEKKKEEKDKETKEIMRKQNVGQIGDLNVRQQADQR